jgi:arsenical pump membrane protein
LIFRKQLSQQIPTERKAMDTPPVDKVRMIVAIVHLSICIVMLTIADFIGVEMWLICLALCVSLILFNLVYGIIKDKNAVRVLLSVKKAPYELIPFVLSMFVLVCGLEVCGATDTLSKLLITNTKADCVIFGYSSAVTANLLNNIPMSVLFSSVIKSDYSHALFGAIIGSNLGAFITPVGALAGIMWSRILSDYDVKLPFYKFVLYGLAVAIPTLGASCLSLFLTV